MDYKNNDFAMYFDTTTKKHIWVLGYFGGGSINFKQFQEAAEDFSKKTGTSIDNVYIDEIFNSSRHKGFKFLTSDSKEQEPLVGSTLSDNVHELLK